jgi:hypothetical protein
MIFLGLKINMSQVWWYTPVIPAVGRLQQEDLEFEGSLGYISKTLSQKNQKQISK